MGKTTIFFLPPHDTEQRRQYGRPVEGGGAPTTQAMGTIGMWGKTERRSRETHSVLYLGLGCSGEADRRRRAAAGYGGRWWRCLGAWEAGGLVGVVRGEVGSRSGHFIGAGRRFGQRFLSSRSFDGRQWW
jgi:hypothetical protein